jgi:hypothetical protein
MGGVEVALGPASRHSTEGLRIDLVPRMPSLTFDHPVVIVSLILKRGVS